MSVTNPPSNLLMACLIFSPVHFSIWLHVGLAYIVFLFFGKQTMLLLSFFCPTILDASQIIYIFQSLSLQSILSFWEKKQGRQLEITSFVTFYCNLRPSLYFLCHVTIFKILIIFFYCLYFGKSIGKLLFLLLTQATFVLGFPFNLISLLQGTIILFILNK